ncbi:MAG: hypothetical protein WKF82_03520 [Nocardioidaceae bacterium]
MSHSLRYTREPLAALHLLPSFEKARQLMAEYRVQVVVEVILERITNISMGVEIDGVVEFEKLAELGEDAPTAISLLD